MQELYLLKVKLMIKTINIIIILIISIFNSDYNSNINKNTTMPIYDITINDIEGNTIKLSDYKGKYVLFVNVASNCGFTRQYRELQKLYNDNDEKLVVVGVPCNQFGGQEPGNEEKISIFCSEKYNVTFPMTEKVSVRGSNQHPLYKWLTSKELNGRKNSSVKWNFQKYLIDKDGNLIDYWYSLTSPTSSKITNYIK
tara:strand:- start:1862 stop:2452 length:591 start_codon:yes stop_codon:yes gene_type:complete